jgi:hypothetical protein
MTARNPREGGRGLSAKKGSDTEGTGDSNRPKRSNSGSRGGRGGGGAKRGGDLGRALRSVYDDTLREAIPDDFLSLIGKLD